MAMIVLPPPQERAVGIDLMFTRAWRSWLELVNARANGLRTYTVATLPPVGPAGAQIFVTNETGGAVPAFSDATNWRRVTDRAVVS